MNFGMWCIMMKRNTTRVKTWLFALLVCLASMSLAQAEDSPFRLGETLHYSMNFGWFEVGTAQIFIKPELEHIDGEAYYSIEFDVRTGSWVRFFTKFDGHFESLVHTETLKPLRSYRNLKHGKKIDIRTDNFYYEDSVRVHAYIEDRDLHRHHKFHEGATPILDLLSTYLSLRNLDLGEVEDQVNVRTFYSNRLYEFQMIPGEYGQQKIKKKRYDTREFRMQFPENDSFGKGKHGNVIISNDQSQIPLKIEVNMVLGSFYFKLEDAK